MMMMMMIMMKGWQRCYHVAAVRRFAMGVTTVRWRQEKRGRQGGTPCRMNNQTRGVCDSFTQQTVADDRSDLNSKKFTQRACGR